MKQLERILEWGGIRRDIAFLVISGIALLASLLPLPPLPFDPAWIAMPSSCAVCPLFWKRSLAWSPHLISRRMFWYPSH